MTGRDWGVVAGLMFVALMTGCSKRGLFVEPSLQAPSLQAPVGDASREWKSDAPQAEVDEILAEIAAIHGLTARPVSRWFGPPRTSSTSVTTTRWSASTAWQRLGVAGLGLLLPSVDDSHAAYAPLLNLRRGDESTAGALVAVTIGTMNADGMDATMGHDSVRRSLRNVQTSAGPGLDAIYDSASITYRFLASFTVACWGNNLTGAVGTGTAGGTRTTPTPVSGQVSVLQIAANGGITDNSQFACALEPKGVRCWGHGLEGQLGNGSNQDSPTAVQVLGLP